MRDRLIEILREPISVIRWYDVVGESRMSVVDAEMYADRLIKNGVIVPPCKVGDTLYILYGEPSYTIKEYEVSTILFGRTHDSIGLSNKSIFTVWEKRWYDFFGKTVFLTREEAEQALQALKAGDSNV